MFPAGDEVARPAVPAGLTLAPIGRRIGGMILGGVIMIASRPFFKAFFSRKRETAPPDVLEEPPPTGPVPAAVDF